MSYKASFLITFLVAVVTATLVATNPAGAEQPIETGQIVITADKVAAGNDGWVTVDVEGGDLGRMWVDPTCRSTLESDGFEVVVVQWATVAALVDAGAASDCTDIPRPQSSGPADAGTQVELLLTSGKANRDASWNLGGWALITDSAGSHKVWVDPTCRSQLEANGITQLVEPWNTIAAIPDGTIDSCNDLLTTQTSPTTTTTTTPPQAPTPTNTLGSGVNFSSGEYFCVDGHGIFEHPISDTQLATQIVELGAETVRLPLNSHCWLGGFDYILPEFQGATYRNRVVNLVDTLNNNGLTVVLDLHWTAPEGDQARGQIPMADADHAPVFWDSVATQFVDNQQIVFDLYNEPHSITWDCWRNGCTDHGYQIAGMQQLVNTVRAAGANQPIILSGLDFAGDLREWLAHVPNDPANNLVAGFHAYRSIHTPDAVHQKRCVTEQCWNNELLPIINAGHGMFIGEAGEDVGLPSCGTEFIDSLYQWANNNSIPFAAWTYNPHGCPTPSILQNWNGDLLPPGQTLKAHLN